MKSRASCHDRGVHTKQYLLSISSYDDDEMIALGESDPVMGAGCMGEGTRPFAEPLAPVPVNLEESVVVGFRDDFMYRPSGFSESLSLALRIAAVSEALKS